MFTLDQVVPWGRSFSEYRRMFRLTPHDLRLSILGCADGPANFNAELTENGGNVVSCDPAYRFDERDIRRRIDVTTPEIIAQTRQNLDCFVWSKEIPTVDSLARLRIASMERFLDDYEVGRSVGRYVCAELPHLPFSNDSFSLALCSHFLFLYSDHFSLDFHLQSLRELLRVANEVRVFPLLSLDAKTSPHVEPSKKALRDQGFDVSVEQVDYEFQKGGNQMLRISKEAIC